MAISQDGGTDPEKILVKVPKGTALPCSEMFGRGVRVEARVGVSVRELLCGQMGVAPGYLENRIQTVFLDGKPLDDTDHAVVEDGAVLSLSAAMPGLVGATLRMGGHLAAMRRGISYREKPSPKKLRAGCVTIKLFNLVARELGPLLLQRGVLVSGRSLAGPVGAAQEAGASMERNGEPVSAKGLGELLETDKEVWFQIAEG